MVRLLLPTKVCFTYSDVAVLRAKIFLSFFDGGQPFFFISGRTGTVNSWFVPSSKRSSYAIVHILLPRKMYGILLSPKICCTYYVSYITFIKGMLHILSPAKVCCIYYSTSNNHTIYKLLPTMYFCILLPA